MAKSKLKNVDKINRMNWTECITGELFHVNGDWIFYDDLQKPYV